MPSNKIQLVIFDLDGVLTETSTYHFQAWKALAKDFGVDLDDAFETQLKGVSRAESLERILKAHHLENVFSEDEKQTLLDKKNTHYQSLISHMTKDHLFDGVIDCFHYLKDQNVNIALGSASKNAPALINALEIQPYIDYVVDPRGLASKPAPDIFLDAMHHFGVTSNACIGIEDAYAGITAINQAGMISIGIGDKKELPHADYCYPSIKAIPLTVIDALLKGVTP
ncbi:MAG: beta-phosphoglucomutase [Bacillota bacterium]